MDKWPAKLESEGNGSSNQQIKASYKRRTNLESNGYVYGKGKGKCGFV